MRCSEQDRSFRLMVQSTRSDRSCSSCIHKVRQLTGASTHSATVSAVHSPITCTTCTRLLMQEATVAGKRATSRTNPKMVGQETKPSLHQNPTQRLHPIHVP